MRRTRTLLFLLALVLLSILSTYAAKNSVAAQENSSVIKKSSSSKQCNATLGTAKSRVETGRDANVDLIQRFSADNGYPPNRPVMLQFTIGGSAGSSIMNSPEFMRSISTDIIDDCSDVSAVAFNLNQTDWTEVFGLIEGKVEKFKCYSPGTPYPGWGYQGCP